MIEKITDKDRVDKGVTGLPDTPQLTTAQMQEKFDELGNMGIDKINEVIDAISSMEEGASGAKNIGATVPEGIISSGDVQSVLDAITTLLMAQKSRSHTHDNKATLDAINNEVKAAYDRIVTLLGGVQSVQPTVTNREDAIPTSAGVYGLLNNFGYQQLKLSLFPIGAIYFSAIAVSPEGFIGGTWERVNLIDGILSWRRTA